VGGGGGILPCNSQGDHRAAHALQKEICTAARHEPKWAKNNSQMVEETGADDHKNKDNVMKCNF
jgi:hypothetical protein